MAKCGQYNHFPQASKDAAGKPYLAINFIQVQRLGGDLHLQLGSSLIDQINCFVGQEAVGNVAV